MKSFWLAFACMLCGAGAISAQSVLFTPSAVALGQVNGTPVLMPQPKAYITVCLLQAGDCVPTTVYSDQAMQNELAQPFTADDLGNIQWWAPSGNYQYEVCDQDGDPCLTYKIGGGNGAPSLPATDTTYGTVKLASGQTSAVLAKVATTGNDLDLINRPANVVSVSAYPGSDAGAQLAAADAAYSGKPVTFSISGTVSSTAVLGSNHGLLVTGPLTFVGGGYITPTTSNLISCDGGGSLLNGGMSLYVTNLYHPFFLAGAIQVKGLRISGCTVEGGNGATLYASPGASTDVQLDHNRLHNTEVFKQNSAGPTNPSARFLIHDNNINWDAGIGWGDYALTSYGAMQDTSVANNVVSNTTGGLEFFASTTDGSIGSSNPTYSQIYGGGLMDVKVTGNVFKNIRGGQSPIFFSTCGHVVAEGNEIDGADDVGVDFEACVDSSAIGNSIKDDETACVGEFFTAVHNAFLNNHCTTSDGKFGVLIKNAGGFSYISTDTTVSGNTYHSQNGFGIFAYIETSSGLKILHNDVTDGVIASGGGYLNGEVIKGNYFHFTRVNPSTGIGSANFPGWGLPLFNNNDGSRMEASDNTVVTDVSQSVACLSGQNSNSNPPDAVYYFTNNTCGGTWGDTTVNSGSTNNAVSPVFVFRNNTLPTSNIQKTSSTGVPAIVVSTGNYVGYSATPIN